MTKDYKFDVKECVVNSKYLLFDIEGTITSIAFVKSYLFPFIKNNLESFIESSWNENDFRDVLKQLKEQVNQDKHDGVENIPDIIEDENELGKSSFIENVLWQMSLDRKTTGLKNLQALILKNGFKNGKLKGEFYQDALNAFKKWKDMGKLFYIYSSGSVEAQKLIFQYSTEGDLIHLISGHYDTNVGPKINCQSYKNILSDLNINPEEIIFFTDVVKEAEAACEIGLKTVLVIRDGNVPISSEDKQRFVTIHSFNELF